MKIFLKYACRGATIIRALKVALLITPLLTIFNHYDEIIALEIGLNFWIQVALTFLVPYAVSTYSSAMAAIGERRKDD